MISYIKSIVKDGPFKIIHILYSKEHHMEGHLLGYDFPGDCMWCD